jgi:hypothetical protein
VTCFRSARAREKSLQGRWPRGRARPAHPGQPDHCGCAGRGRLEPLPHLQPALAIPRPLHGVVAMTMTSGLAGLNLWSLWSKSTDRHTSRVFAAAIPVGYWAPFLVAPLVRVPEWTTHHIRFPGSPACRPVLWARPPPPSPRLPVGSWIDVTIEPAQPDRGVNAWIPPGPATGCTSRPLTSTPAIDERSRTGSSGSVASIPAPCRNGGHADARTTGGEKLTTRAHQASPGSCWARVEERCSVEAMVAGYERIYQQVLPSGDGASRVLGT